MNHTRACAAALVSLLLAPGALAQERVDPAPAPEGTSSMPAPQRAAGTLLPEDATPGLRVGAQLLAGVGGFVGGGLVTAGVIGGILQSSCPAGGECALHAIPWFGPGAGLGSALAVSLVGNLFTHEPAFVWALAGGLGGGLLSTGLWALDARAGMVATLALPLLGSMLGYQGGLGAALAQRPRWTVVPLTRGDELGLALAGTF